MAKRVPDVSPQQLFGRVENKKAVQAFMAMAPHPSFAVAAEPLQDTGKGKVVLLQEAVKQVVGKYLIHQQTIGDCFPAGTMILGETVRPIESLRIGDRVWTAEGKLTRVVSTRAIETARPLVKVSSVGGLPLTCTADHRVLAYRLPHVGQRRVSSASYASTREHGTASVARRVAAIYEARVAEWVPAGELTRDDCLLTPLTLDSIPVPQSASPYWATADGRFLLGYFAGNGHASGGTVELAYPESALGARVADCARTLGFDPHDEPYRPDTDCRRVRIHNRIFVAWCRDVFYDADGVKQFPAWAIGDPDFFAGLHAADGHRTDGPDKAIDSTSLSIIHGAARTLLAWGEIPMLAEVSRSVGTYDNAKPLYRVRWRPERARVHAWRDDKFLCRPVLKVEHIEGPTTVYDIGVADAHHSFVADGHGVHNCVSHGFGLGVDVLRCVQIAIKGAMEKWLGEVATEIIYGGSRVEIGGGQLGNSDGSSGGWAAQWLMKYGVLLRQAYGSYDFTTYSGTVAKKFGRAGVPDELEPRAREFPVRTCSLITTYEEARDAIANGYPVAVCSNVGFQSMRRDKDGFIKPSGSWPHCYTGDTWVAAPVPSAIADVRVGQPVYGLDGQAHTVTQKHERYFEGNLAAIKAAGLPETRPTECHPILVYRPTRSAVVWREELAMADDPQVSEGGRQAAAVATKRSTKFAYVKASDVTEGDYLCVPLIPAAKSPVIPEWPEHDRCQSQLPRLEAGPLLAWWFGLYAADGTAKADHRVGFTLNTGDDIARCVAGFRALGLEPRVEEHDTYVRVIADHAGLARAMKGWFGGGRKAHKRLPPWLLTWDLADVLSGLQHGDGGAGAKGLNYVNTSSPALFHQVFRMAATLGRYPMSHSIRRDRPGAFPNAKPSWRINWRTEPKRREGVYAGDFYCLPVRKTELRPFVGPVFNLEVEDVHSYVADLAATHNCMLFSGVNDASGRPGLQCDNSWGPDWVSGPKGELPLRDGSFWIDADVCNKMLRQQDSYVLSDAVGYPALLSDLFTF